MKKLFVALLAFCLMLPLAYADNLNKKLEKAQEKQYKEKLKELKKGKWNVYGSSRTLEVALLSHFIKLQEAESAQEVVGTSTNAKSKNAGHQMAINNACIIYAQQAGSKVKGRVVSDMGTNNSDTIGEFDHFYAAYERLVGKEINGQMTESFTVMREQQPGVFEFQSFFIVDESAASLARMRALEEALKESEAAQRNAEKISEFVKEGVD